MNNGEFKPGQSINTPDVIYLPDTQSEDYKATERAKDNVSEALEYPEKHPELKQKLSNATSLLESLSTMSHEELQEQAEKNGTFLSTVETFNNITRQNAEREAKMNELETRKLDSNLDNKEKANGILESDDEAYARQKQEIQDQYHSETTAEDALTRGEGVLVAEEIEKEREKIQLEITDIENDLKNLEMEKDNGQIALDKWSDQNRNYEDEKNKLEQQLADAHARLDAVGGDTEAQKATDEALQKAYEDKVRYIEAQYEDDKDKERYDEDLEKAKQAFEEGKIDALINRAGDNEKNREILDQIVKDGKDELEGLDWQKDDGQIWGEDYDNAVKAAQDKIDNPAKYLAEYKVKQEAGNKAESGESESEAKPFNETPGMEKMRPEDLAAMANWYANQDLARRELAANIAKGDPAALDWLERHPAFKDEMGELISEREKNLSESEKQSESEAFEAFYQESLADEGFRRTYGGSDEEFREWIRPMFDARQQAEQNSSDAEAEKALAEEQKKTANQIGEMMAEGEEDVAGEKKGIFSKIKGFFSRSNRVKSGKEEGVKKTGLHGWKKALTITLMALSVASSIRGNVISAEAPDQTGLLEEAAEHTLQPEMTGENLDSTITVTIGGEQLEINTANDLWDGESDYYTEVGEEMGTKSGKYNLTSRLYDMQNTGNMANAEVGQSIENLYGRSSDPSESGQFAPMTGSNFQIGGNTNGVTNLSEMSHVMRIAESDDNARELMHQNTVNVLDDIFDNQELQLIKHQAGESHGSLYIVDADGSLQYVWQDETNPAQEDFYAVTTEKFNSNEAGGYKDRYLRAVGVIPEGASEAEAQKIMESYDIEISLKCGQVILVSINQGGSNSVTVILDSSDEKATKETDEKTTSEKETKETDEKTTSEKDTKETDEKTTSEKETKETDEKTTSEKDTKETEEKTTSEKDTKETEEYDGKTNILPGEDGDGWTQRGLTPEDSTPRSEAGGDNGYTNDHTPGSSSDRATIPVEDKNGETASPTDSTYSGDTSGWQGNTPSGEQGTQTINEPSAPEVNDTQANPDSAGANDNTGADRNEAMNRFDNR